MPADIPLDDVFARMTDPLTTVDEARDAMARLDGRELDALPGVFAILRGSDDLAVVQAAARLLRRWAALPLADALPGALRAMIAEQGVGDVNKLAAGALLESLGHPLDEHELARSLDDPEALKHIALERLIEATARPAALVHALETMAGQPVEHVLAMIDDLTALARPEAVRILGPLAHSTDADVAISAIAALDLLGAPDAAPSLAAIARHHADATVRRQAAHTAGRLPVAASPNGVAGRDDGPASTDGGALAWLQPAPGAVGGDRLIVVAAAPDAHGARDVLTVLTRGGSGIVTYAVAGNLAPEGLESLRERIVAGGIALSPSSVAAARERLDAATAETLADGRFAGVAWAAWRWVLPPQNAR